MKQEKMEKVGDKQDFYKFNIGYIELDKVFIGIFILFLIYIIYIQFNEIKRVMSVFRENIRKVFRDGRRVI